MCVSLPDSGHRALRVFLQCQGAVKGAGRADGVQHVCLWPFSPCSVFAGVLGCVFLCGGCRGTRGAHAVLTEGFPG